ncbi:SHOCT domain-containing protein [Cellulomonas sp.]|uniref:SHOCT domain-containing protein n=1 Tax=Cellulomonas sp. TaxID=40001 RepID=UPI001B072B9B|nr:SHOCT domain-containing protein [Cellulomonas sp.]MBO9553407.1 SHOCT domain-containing protein [Cellulomonas sp.]
MPGLIRGVARTAVVAGTASAVSGRVQRRQQGRWAAQDAAAAGYPPPQQSYAAPAPTYAPPPPPPPAYAQPVYVEAAAPDAPDMDAKIAQLKQLAELRDQGILTHAEFEAQKTQILAG